MSQNPLNNALRFLLEMWAIMVYAYWGYHLTASGWRVPLAVIMSFGFMFLWGVFAVRGDPSRSGKTVIQTPGVLRLILELALFAAAVFMLFSQGHSQLAWFSLAAIFLHYLLSFDRLAWLLKQK